MVQASVLKGYAGNPASLIRFGRASFIQPKRTATGSSPDAQSKTTILTSTSHSYTAGFFAHLLYSLFFSAPVIPDTSTRYTPIWGSEGFSPWKNTYLPSREKEGWWLSYLTSPLITTESIEPNR